MEMLTNNLDSNIEKVTRLKLLLHTLVYKNSNFTTILNNNLKESISHLINYNSNTGLIDIKVSKKDLSNNFYSYNLKVIDAFKKSYEQLSGFILQLIINYGDTYKLEINDMQLLYNNTSSFVDIRILDSGVIIIAL